MPPKRRGPHSKAPPPKAPPPPDPPAITLLAPVPPRPPTPTPPLPPPMPPESDAARVRREWSKFIDTWYEPQKKKLVEKLQKDLLVKYKNLGSPKETQKLREMELFEKLDSLVQQLAQPARAEWERRLDLARLREDQWDDMSGEDQHAVMSVFVGFYNDDLDDMDDHDDDNSTQPSSIEEDSSIEDPHLKHAPAPARLPVPPTPTRAHFEFVNPTSFFTDLIAPSDPTKKLPALSMDHLATLAPSVPSRSPEPVSAGPAGVLGFQHWASEAGILTQPPQAPSSKTQPQPQPQPQPPPPPPQTLSARPRPTDLTSRQPSAASNMSPPLNVSSPQFSPPNPTTKFSPPINTEVSPLGKRYIGPVITEDDPDPLDEELLKSKMAYDYQQYKISLRIQMIYQFHAEAADIEIKLFESLLAGEGTKESRARAVQEHESSMMRLREQKEEDRKRLCAEEREKRREEIRSHLAQRPKPAPSWPDKPSVQQRPPKVTLQKENVPVPSPALAKLEPPSAIKKSNSTLSQDEVSANEALFANAMAAINQGKASATGLTPAQASLNETIFANAAAMLATKGPPPETNAKSALQPPSIMKKSNSARSQEPDVPHITVSFAEPPTAPEPAQAPPTITTTTTTARGKKGKKGQQAAQPPPVKPVAIAEQSDVDAELPPAPSLWDTAAVAAKNVWGAASATISAPNAWAEGSTWDADPTPLPAPPKGNVNAKKAASAGKKGKKVTIAEEPDVDADPIVPPPPASKAKATKGAWGAANGRSKVAPPVVEESEPEPASPAPPAMPAWGKKGFDNKSSQKKPQLKVAISEETESEFEPVAPPARTNKAKSTWGVPAETGKKATQQRQAEPRRGAAPGFRSVRVDPVLDPEDVYPTVDDDMMPGALDPTESDETEELDASTWFNPENMSYWDKFMGGPSPVETQAVPETDEQPGKHARWTPTVNGESDEEDGEADEDTAAAGMWMQYAVSGVDISSLGGSLEEPQRTPSETHRDTTVWEQGKGKKQLNSTGDAGNRAQQTSVFDRAAFTGQWPKMESWLSPPSRGQNSGSTRVF